MSSVADSDVEDLATLIAGRVRSHRKSRGWTLDELAHRSGVSRRMLVNIEQAATNPSIATLLRVSDSLGIGLPALVQHDSPEALRIVRADTRVPVWTSPNGGRALMVAGTEAPDVVELWDWTLGPGDAHRSEPHRTGTRELLTVISGRLLLRVAENEEVLKVGDSATFDAAVSHAYINPTNRKTRFTLTVHEPGVGTEQR